MHGRRIAVGLTGLGHHIADIDLEGTASAQLLSNTTDQEVRHDACIEAAGTEDDCIRCANRLERGWHRCDILREQAYAADASRYLGDMRFTLDDRPVLEDRVKAHGLLRCGQDTPLDREDLRGLAQRCLHVASDLRHRSEKEIAEAVPREIACSLKTMLKEFFHQRFGVGKCDETVAQIARRDNAELFAQTSRGAAVVRHRHDGSHVARQFLDTAQEHREPMSAADYRDGRTAAEPRFFIDHIHEAR